MAKRWLLYDAGCSVCAALAWEVEALSGGRLQVRSLRDPEVQALLDRARPGWQWEPMLVEVEAARVRVWAGLAMRMRLLQILGPVRALRAAQAVARHGGPVLGVDWGRRDFLRRATGALAGWIALRGLGRPVPAAAASPTPPRIARGNCGKASCCCPPAPPFLDGSSTRQRRSCARPQTPRRRLNCAAIPTQWSPWRPGSPA